MFGPLRFPDDDVELRERSRFATVLSVHDPERLKVDARAKSKPGLLISVMAA